MQGGGRNKKIIAGPGRFLKLNCRKSKNAQQRYLKFTLKFFKKEIKGKLCGTCALLNVEDFSKSYFGGWQNLKFVSDIDIVAKFEICI